MSRSRLTFFLVSAVLVLALLGGGLLGAAQDEPAADDSLYKYLSVFTEVMGLIRQAYVDEADLGALMAGALDGTTDALDPFSVYVPPGEVDAFVAARAAIARTTGLTLLKDRGVVFVVAVEPGSPADAAGILTSDLVSEIGGESTRTMPLWQAEERLAAPPGGKVALEVIRVGDTLELTLEPRPYEPEPARFERSAEAEPQAVLRLVRFGAKTADAVRAALGKVAEEGHGRLLVDLRGVAGGDPAAAYAVAGLFTGGELGTLRRKGEVLETFRGEAEPVWGGPIVVLVSRGTLGPAEIVATVLRQKAGADLVGERTFGWAGRQDSAEVGTGGRLFFTDAFYTGPDGEPLRSGLDPDVAVDEDGRGLAAQDKPLGDLILERGLERLREKAAGTSLPQAA
jgi:carboxyl-terminal processing protease